MFQNLCVFMNCVRVPVCVNKASVLGIVQLIILPFVDFAMAMFKSARWFANCQLMSGRGGIKGVVCTVDWSF